MGRTVIWIKRVHRWLGLLLALPLVLQGVTGCVLAATPFFVELTSPRIHRDPGRLDDVAAIVAAAEAAAPGLRARRYSAPKDAAVTVELAAPRQQFGGGSTLALIDPTTLRVLSVGAAGGFYRWAHSLHENLLMPQFGGRSIIGWIGVGLLLLAVSGIPLWWPRSGRLRAAISVQRRARGAALFRQLHGAAGIWIVAILIVQAATGVTLGFPETARALFGAPNMEARPSSPRGGVEAAPDVATLTAHALAAAPGAPLVELRLPSGARAAVAFLGRGALPIVVQMSANGQVLAVRDPWAEGGGALALALMRALHYGDLLGLIWLALLCMSGVLLPLLPITGVLLWLRKRRSRSVVDARRRAALGAPGE